MNNLYTDQPLDLQSLIKMEKYGLESGLDTMDPFLGKCPKEAIGAIDDWLYYDFPPEYLSRKETRNWRGQRQKWFALRFHGDEKKINLMAHGPQEFSEWKWGDLSQIPDLIVPFKRKVYERIALDFEPFAVAIKMRCSSY